MRTGWHQHNLEEVEAYYRDGGRISIIVNKKRFNPSTGKMEPTEKPYRLYSFEEKRFPGQPSFATMDEAMIYCEEQRL